MVNLSRIFKLTWAPRRCTVVVERWRNGNATSLHRRHSGFDPRRLLQFPRATSITTRLPRSSPGLINIGRRALDTSSSRGHNVTMATRKSRATVSKLARQTGANTRPSSRLTFLRSVLKKWSSRQTPASGQVIFAGEDAPRDLDDPLGDPKVQARVGEAIAKRARQPRK